MKLLQWLIPRTPKRNLLFIAALVWTFAGGMLLTRGMMMMDIDRDFFLLRLSGSFVGGVLFYFILFIRISKQHVDRIIHLDSDHPSIFSFFNAKSYVMMIGMISMGVFLRKSGVVSPFYLSIFYVTMGIPLIVSSLRFYYSGIYYQSMIRKNNNLPQ